MATLGLPLLECIYCVGCSRWAWKRCTHTASDDSRNWAAAAPDEFEAVPRLCRLILAVYEDDLRHPRWAPPGGYGIDPDFVVKRVSYDVTQGRAPPYLIYLDRVARAIVLAVRGLNLTNNHDYAVLLDNRTEASFDGGFVHRGLLKSAVWLLEQEAETLSRLATENPEYSVTLAGHSLGSGIAALLAAVAAKCPERLNGAVTRRRLRCFAIAPARCMSLNLAVKYADVVSSVVLQDDFLPRTATPLEDIFGSVFCLPCLLCFRCMRDTCISEERMLKDPKRLYAPGRLYHIVDRKSWRCGRYPPVVKTAVPVDQRFEHIILSCNATKDHGIIWIEKEARKALDLMLENENPMDIPLQQKMERKETIAKGHEMEHKTALERAVSLNIPHVSSESTSGDHDEGSSGKALVNRDGSSSDCDVAESSTEKKIQRKKSDWDELMHKLFEEDSDGKVVSK